MRKPKLPPGSVDDVEASFYEALQRADIDRLMRCWADEDDIVCVHPGGPRLHGALAIRAAFEALFAVGPIRVVPEHVVKLNAHGCGVHHVIERVEVMSDDGPRQAYVVATNVYLKTAQGWRLVAHHASPGQADSPVDVRPVPVMLH